MPVCVTCTAPVPYLYTVYKTRSNIRLSTCDNCQNFADPLIEHPPIIHLLDLVLLKPRAFLHLLYNRGHQPSYADAGSTDPSATGKTDTAFDRQSSFGLDTARRADLLRVGTAANVAETVIRLCQLAVGHVVSGTSSSAPRPTTAVAMLLLVVLELAAQLLISSALALFLLKYRTWWPNPSTATFRDGRQAHFRPIVVPLTLLYTSIIPLLLHATLQIWTTPPSIAPFSAEYALPMAGLFARHMTASHLRYLTSLYNEAAHVWCTSDKIWTGTRLLAGMSAGFGLRVVLPLKPWEVSAVVLAGWAAGAGVSAFVADTVGQVRLG